MPRSKTESPLRRNEPGESSGLSENTRTLVSLALFVHLCCVFIVLSSNLAPSRTQARLVEFLAPYTRTLNLDPNFVPFHLISGEPIDNFHYLEIETAGGTTVRLPGDRDGTGFSSGRFPAVAHVIAFYSAGEIDQTSAELARSIGGRVLAETGETRAVLRCVQQAVPARDSGQVVPRSLDDPAATRLRSVVYEADIWQDADGVTQVLKRAAAGEVAAPQNGE